MLTATAATFWLSALALGRPVLPAEIPAAAWGGIAGVGIVSTFVAVQAFYAGAHRIGAARASIVSTVEPIWTIVLANLLFAEVLGPLQLVGGAMILAGVVIAQSGPSAVIAARSSGSPTSRPGSLARRRGPGGRQGGRRALGDEGPFRPDAEEPEPALEVRRERPVVVEEDAGRLAVAAAGGDDRIQRGRGTSGSPNWPGIPRECDRSAGPTKRTSTPSSAAIASASRTALGDSIWTIPTIAGVQRPDVGVPDGPEPRAPRSGGRRHGPRPADSAGR